MQCMNFDGSAKNNQKSYKKHFGEDGINLNMDWILMISENVFICMCSFVCDNDSVSIYVGKYPFFMWYMLKY